MAVTVFGLKSGFDTTDQTADFVHSGTITPTNGRVLFARSILTVASGNPDLPTLSGLGATWTQIGTLLWNGGIKRTTTFWGYVASYTPGQITTQVSGGVTHTGCMIQIVESDNTNVSAPVLQSNIAFGNSSGTATVGLSGVVGTTLGFAATIGGTVTPGSGFTELHEGAMTAPAVWAQAEWQQAPVDTIDCTFTSSAWVIEGIEIREASAGGFLLTQLESGNRGVDRGVSRGVSR